MGTDDYFPVLLALSRDWTPVIFEKRMGQQSKKINIALILEDSLEMLARKGRLFLGWLRQHLLNVEHRLKSSARSGSRVPLPCFKHWGKDQYEPLHYT